MSGSNPGTTGGTDATSAAPVDSRISREEGLRYWEGISADVSGMLGGFPRVSKVDLQGSCAFLAKLGIGSAAAAGRTRAGGSGGGLREVDRALEGGAGIGRITLGLLTSVARAVDVVEPIARFTDTGLRGKHPRVANIYNVGLEEWAPDLAPSVPAAEASSTALQRDGAGREGMEVRRARRKYGLIWTQWCVGHLTDDQLVEYLRRCTLVLEGERASEGSAEGAENDSAARDGVIVLKENVTSSKDDIYDERDSSVTRTDEKFRQIFDRAGLRIVRVEQQHGFPHGLYPVMMYALKPKRR